MNALISDWETASQTMCEQIRFIPERSTYVALGHDPCPTCQDNSCALKGQPCIKPLEIIEQKKEVTQDNAQISKP